MSVVANAALLFELQGEKAYHKQYVAEIKDKLVEVYASNIKLKADTEYTLAAQAKAFQEEKEKADELYKETITSLTSNNDRLRKQWRTALQRAEQADASSTASRSNGEANFLQGHIAEDLRNAKLCDGRIVQLQDTIDSYLKQINGKGWYDATQQ